MKNEIRLDVTRMQRPEDRKVNLGRHRAQCSICRHPQRAEIERDWLDWVGVATIEFKYKVSRDALYRHCHALGLFSKRRKNLIRAHERIAERHDTVNYSGSNILSALREIAKLDSAEKAVDASQSADEKPAVQETTAEERNNGALVGSIAEMLDEMSGPEAGQGQNEQKEPQGPKPTVQ